MHDISQFLQRHWSGNKWVMVKRVWQWASEPTKTSQVFWELPTYPESLAVAPGHNLSSHGWWWCGDDYECDGWWYSRRGATIKNAQDCLIQDADLWRGGWNESQESAKSIRSHNCEHFRRGLSKGGPSRKNVLYTMVNTKYHLCRALARSMMKTNWKRTLKKIQNKPLVKAEW